MTLQDFIAASQGDERLGTARWLCFHGSAIDEKDALKIPPAELVQSDFETDWYEPDWFKFADAVLALMEETRKEDEARIEDLECQIEADQRSSDSIVSDFDKMRDGRCAAEGQS
jgi:hypothetical protein